MSYSSSVCWWKSNLTLNSNLLFLWWDTDSSVSHWTFFLMYGASHVNARNTGISARGAIMAGRASSELIPYIAMAIPMAEPWKFSLRKRMVVNERKGKNWQSYCWKRWTLEQPRHRTQSDDFLYPLVLKGRTSWLMCTKRWWQNTRPKGGVRGWVERCRGWRDVLGMRTEREWRRVNREERWARWTGERFRSEILCLSAPRRYI